MPIFLFKYIDYISKLRSSYNSSEKVSLNKQLEYRVDVVLSVHPYAKPLALLVATLLLICLGGLALFGALQIAFGYLGLLLLIQVTMPTLKGSLLNQLAIANESLGGGTVVVMAERDIAKMEFDFRGDEVLVIAEDDDTYAPSALPTVFSFFFFCSSSC
ncbi:hypothetical protein V6N11_007300 [Hibiscus sabdariffa]|uniref:ABC transmembrane type-1 domain-containing protein n=1 Tax=Hibiscus sabdariffa TaxID=183260 RepID=A0ABR2RTN3_9ROSI